MRGSARIRSAPAGLDLLTVSIAVMFTMMYAIFIFVDVAWEPRNVSLLALSMGLCTANLRQAAPDGARQVGDPLSLADSSAHHPGSAIATKRPHVVA